MTTELNRLIIHRDYDYRRTVRLPGGGETEQWVGTYGLLGYCRHAHTLQELVLYEGITGKDAGDWFVVTLHAFALRFTLLPLPPAPAAAPVAAAAEPEPAPARAAGTIPPGSDV